MKKITFLSFILVLMISSSVQASEWAYPFVVWDGKEYEVKEAILIDESEIGKRIGKVKTEPYSDNRSSAMRYYGNASNVYPVGTPYYEVKGVSTATAIAVKVDNGWARADYIREAPKYFMDTVKKTFNIVLFSIIGVISIGYIYRAIKRRNQKHSTHHM